MRVSSFAVFLGKSGLMVYECWSDISQQRILVQWVLSAGMNARKMQNINRLKEDALSDQQTSDLSAPFTGSK